MALWELGAGHWRRELEGTRVEVSGVSWVWNSSGCYPLLEVSGDFCLEHWVWELRAEGGNLGELGAGKNPTWELLQPLCSHSVSNASKPNVGVSITRAR